MEAGDEALKKTLIEGNHKVRCPSCNAPNTLSPVGKAGSAGFRRWKCGARVGESGCRKTCARVIVFGDALGAGNPRAWASIAPIKLTRRINLLEIGSTQEAVPRPRVAKQSGPGPKVSADKASTNVTSLLNELEGELQKELKLEQGSKILGLLMKTVRTALASTGIPEDRVPAAVSEEVKVARSVPVVTMRPQSYAKAASKGGREWVRPTIRKLEVPMKAEDKEALGLKHFNGSH